MRVDPSFGPRLRGKFWKNRALLRKTKKNKNISPKVKIVIISFCTTVAHSSFSPPLPHPPNHFRFQLKAEFDRVGLTKSIPIWNPLFSLSLSLCSFFAIFDSKEVSLL